MFRCSKNCLLLAVCFAALQGGAFGESTADWQAKGEGSWGNRPCLDDGIWKLGALGFTTTTCFRNFFLVDAEYSRDDEHDRGSFGVGVRNLFCNNRAMWGANLYYDYRNTSPHGQHQVGVGVELLSCFADFRANVYLPVGDKQYRGPKHIFSDYEGDYEASCWTQTTLAKGYDFEVGKQFCLTPCLGIYVGVGGYGVNFHKCCDVFGGMGRIRLKYMDIIYLESNLYHDKTFHTNGEVKLGFQISLCKLQECFAFIHQPVIRRNYICSTRCCRYETNY